MIDYTELPEDRIVVMRVSGLVSADEMEGFLKRLQAFIDQHGDIKVLKIVHDFRGVDPRVFFRGLWFDLRNWKHFTHVASVGDKEWQRQIADFINPALKMELKAFAPEEETAAMEWLRSV